MCAAVLFIEEPLANKEFDAYTPSSLNLMSLFGQIKKRKGFNFLLVARRRLFISAFFLIRERVFSVSFIEEIS